MVRTVDTYVVVLAISLCYSLPNLEELFLAFETGKHFKIIQVHEIAKSLWPLTCKALPLFHTILGCDTTSRFSGKDNKSCWDAWKAYPNPTDTLIIRLLDQPQHIKQEDLEVIERYIVVVYQRTCDSQTCN